MRIYHPAYERKRDRVTGVVFLPVELDGKRLATAEVTDPDRVRSLLSRGFLPWPGQNPPEGAPPAPSAPPPPPGGPAAHLPTAEELDGMTAAELRVTASTLGIELPAKGTKAELRALILAPF